MKGKALVPLIVGLVVGVIAIKMTFDLVRKAQGSTVSGEQVAVVRAKAPIPMAAEITDTMVQVVQAPKAFVPSGAFTKKEDVIGRVSNTAIPKDMPVVTSMLAPKGTKPGIVSRVKPGYRAVALKVDESSGVGYLLKPGCFVDVVAVMAVKKERTTETISKTILENVEVVAVGDEMGESGETGAKVVKSVTVLVLPEDVPRLHLAAQKGKILLAMRNFTDDETEPVAAATESGLLGNGEKSDGSEPAPQASKWLANLMGAGRVTDNSQNGVSPNSVATSGFNPSPGEFVVEVYRPGKVEYVRFDSPNATERSDAAGATGRSSRPMIPSSRLNGLRFAEPNTVGSEPGGTDSTLPEPSKEAGE